MTNNAEMRPVKNPVCYAVVFDQYGKPVKNKCYVTLDGACSIHEKCYAIIDSDGEVFICDGEIFENHVQEYIDRTGGFHKSSRFTVYHVGHQSRVFEKPDECEQTFIEMQKKLDEYCMALQEAR